MLITCSLCHCPCVTSPVNRQSVYCSQLAMNTDSKVQFIHSAVAYTYKTRRVVILNSFGIAKCF